MRLSCRNALLLALLAGACAPLQRLTGRDASPEQLASGVTISRDEWGVPYIEGATPAHVAFGVGYAQAEDGYAAMEEAYLHALGRASHWYGDRFLAADLVRSAFEVERLAREEYEREPPDRRAIWDAFAEGVNYYIRTSGTRPRLITRIEPWMPFALVRTVDDATVVDGVPLDTITTTVGAGAPVRDGPRETGFESMVRAVAPSRTADGHALLLAIGRGEFFGARRDYEMALISDDGWHVRGFALLGTPVPRIGHNDSIAWAHAAPTADVADAWRVRLETRAGSPGYQFDGDWRAARVWQDTLLVNSETGVQSRVVTFSATHHGPIVATGGADAIAIRIARMEEGGSLQQWYAMSRASNVDEFRAALAAVAVDRATVYADAAGNILHVHAGAVPLRDASLDWTKPVDGSSARTDWQGYHPLDDVPQTLNPADGWIDAGTLAAGGYAPGYMSVRADSGAAGARTFTDSTWTFEAWSDAAFDTRVAAADDAVASLAIQWEQVGGTDPVRARRLDNAVDRLRSWDGATDTASVEATLFVLWQERLRSGDATGGDAEFRAMENVIASLHGGWGSDTVSWGELNRLQRPDAVPPRFSDAAPSIAVPGAPAWAGATFSVTSERQEGTRRRYAVRGVTTVMATEMAPAARSATIVTFGQSADPASPHFFDQAALFAGGELKRAWFAHDAVASNARRVYSPGAPVRQQP